VQTVDQRGLQSRFLRRHQSDVARLYEYLERSEYHSAEATGYQRRLLKNRDKLFTFLDYDGVPWNNNNAEHAIKAFVAIRNVIGGTSSEKGIREYLTLLSISETCKCKVVRFLDFLR